MEKKDYDEARDEFLKQTASIVMGFGRSCLNPETATREEIRLWYDGFMHGVQFAEANIGMTIVIDREALKAEVHEKMHGVEDEKGVRNGRVDQ